MFIPEPDDYFHIYTEEHGLLKNTVFRCLKTDSKLVTAEYVAGGRPAIKTPCVFPRSMVSFWPVQPGYRQHLLGRAMPSDNSPADPSFTVRFKQLAKLS